MDTLAVNQSKIYDARRFKKFLKNWGKKYKVVFGF